MPDGYIADINSAGAALGITQTLRQNHIANPWCSSDFPDLFLSRWKKRIVCLLNECAEFIIFYMFASSLWCSNQAIQSFQFVHIFGVSGCGSPFYNMYFAYILVTSFARNATLQRWLWMATRVCIYIYTNLSASMQPCVYQYDRTQKLNVQTLIINSITECVSPSLLALPLFSLFYSF